MSKKKETEPIEKVCGLDPVHLTYLPGGKITLNQAGAEEILKRHEVLMDHKPDCVIAMVGELRTYIHMHDPRVIKHMEKLALYDLAVKLFDQERGDAT